MERTQSSGLREHVKRGGRVGIFDEPAGARFSALAGWRNRGFPLEQRPLAVHAPPVSRKAAVTPHDAVARDGDGDGIGAAGLGDGSDGFGHADPSGDIGVGGGGPGRDFAKSIPDALLKRGAANIQREVGAQLWRFDQTDDLGNQGFESAIPSLQIRLREPALEIGDESIRIIPEKNRADPYFRSGDQHRTQRAFTHGEANGDSFTTPAEIVWLHTQKV